MKTSVRRIAVGVWLAASLVQFVIWAMICIISADLSSPWWLWTVGVGGAIVAGLWVATSEKGVSS